MKTTKATKSTRPAALKAPEPPSAYTDFNERFPELADAWDLTRAAGARGPIDRKTSHLLKLAVSIGALREGAVRSAARKAAAGGITPEELDQVVAIASSTIGFPASVAAWSWIRSAASGKTGRRR